MKSITLKPSSGGRLMSDLSSGSIGMSNYITKRDWRRVLEGEIRAEGHVKFAPNPNTSESTQAYPPGVDGAITLIAEATLPSGRVAVIVGTQRTLWVYYGLYNGSYVDGDANGAYVSGTYFSENPGDWQQIGGGFSMDGKRWEAVPVGELLVLNNGVDLPMTYRAGESEVVPIWELREQGVASVGTIAEINGILCCFDIRQIPDDILETISGAVGASVPGAVSGNIKSTTRAALPIHGGSAPIFGGSSGIFGN